MVWGICDILRRSNCKGAMQYVPELTWILFLRILDEREQKDAYNAAQLSIDFTPSLALPYRWHDWAATPEEDDPLLTARDGKPQGWKRRELTEGKSNAFIAWVNTELLPHLRGLEKLPNATPRQKVISEIMSSVERVRIDTDKNFQDVLDRVPTRAAEAGVDLVTLATLLGHSRVQMVMRYAHPTQEHQFNAIKKMEAYRVGKK